MEQRFSGLGFRGSKFLGFAYENREEVYTHWNLSLGSVFQADRADVSNDHTGAHSKPKTQAPNQSRLSTKSVGGPRAEGVELIRGHKAGCQATGKTCKKAPIHVL